MMRGSAQSAEIRTADKYDLRSEGVLNNKSKNQFMEWCENIIETIDGDERRG